MSEPTMHPTYLPFTEDQVRGHFARVDGDPRSEPDRHLAYYRKSIQRFEAHLDSPAGATPAEVRRARQIEKDERFWVAAALMALYYAPDPPAVFAQLLKHASIEAPAPHDSWQTALAGELHLFFEVGLPSPKHYDLHLREHLDERTPIPYVREAANKSKRPLEGFTHVDALLLSATTGVGVLLEAKVLSDCSATVTYDVLRNQLARTIDVMLESQPGLPIPLCDRKPEASSVVLLTPELFRQRRHTRLYGWLFDEYRDHPEAIHRDLPHRSADWEAVARRIGWATFEDVKRIRSDACVWLPPPGHAAVQAHDTPEDQ